MSMISWQLVLIQHNFRDFEAAASLMKPSSKSKDNRVLSLSKKAELLENQLKTSELEHARYVMLGRCGGLS